MNKTVLITGSTGVIGKATALELAKNNCRLILSGRSAEKLNKLKSEISASSGDHEIDIMVADLSEPESIHLGPFTLTNELLDLLKSGKPARIVTVSAPSTTKINFDDIIQHLSGNPGKAATMLCSLAIDDKYLNSNGRFYKFNGKEIKSSSNSHNKELQEKLWSISEQLSKSVIQ